MIRSIDEESIVSSAAHALWLCLPDAPETEEEEVKAWEEPVEMLNYLPAAPDLNSIASEPILKLWNAIHIENPYVRLMILPEFGGRIHLGLDKISGYDFFHLRNANCSQHHHPAMSTPVETEIERHQDGSVTVWCGDYDRASCMKGMHGVCLHPDRTVVELKSRLYNGTECVQTFSWAPNTAAKMQEDRQSFPPQDANNLNQHSERDVRAGFVHIANRHTVPGQKQWSWGNHDFSYPAFSFLPPESLVPGFLAPGFLTPGETKTFSQFWYPLRNSGVPLDANLDAAICLEASDGVVSLSVCVTHDLCDAIVMLKHASHLLEVWEQDLTVEEGFQATVALPIDCDTTLLSLEVRTETGRVLNCSLAPQPEMPAPATAAELDLPESIASLDELFLTGTYLEQFRHPKHSPEAYWREAIRRDSGDLRCNHALAKSHYKRGEYALAEGCIRVAVARASRLHGNPCDGEIFYTLGLILRRLNRLDEAYESFHKATQSQAWRSAGYHAVAEIDAVRNDLDAAIRHLDLSLLTNADSLNARNLYAALLRKLDRDDEASDLLAHTSDLDRLDLWSRFLDGVDLPQSGHQLLSLGLLMERGGQIEDAIEVFKTALMRAHDGSTLLLHLALGRCSASLQHQAQEKRHLDAAIQASPDNCFPNGLDHFDLLQYAIARRPQSARLRDYLGNLAFHSSR